MQKRKEPIFTLETLVVPLALCFFMWLVYWFEIRFNFNFNNFGIKPGMLIGLRGVLFGPFIHSSLSHLWHNTLPLLILTAALLYFYKPISWKVLLWGTLVTGLLTWIIARPSTHIGASGVVYFLCSFLFFKGVWSKHYRLIALSLIIIFVYGSLIWGTLPGAVEDNISWEGHLSGLLTGILMALIYRKKVIFERDSYKWEQEDYNDQEDPFMRHFDEDGNFIELQEDSEEKENESDASQLDIQYHYKKKE